jgi:hypothetical protein
MSCTLANPVEARLVELGVGWPGVRFGIGGIEERRCIEGRPEVFFDPDGEVPEEVTLELARPGRLFARRTEGEFAKLIQHVVLKREKVFREKARLQGLPFLGVERVLARKPTE